jgi:hypothetical protein
VTGRIATIISGIQNKKSSFEIAKNYVLGNHKVIKFEDESLLINQKKKPAVAFNFITKLDPI